MSNNINNNIILSNKENIENIENINLEKDFERLSTKEKELIKKVKKILMITVLKIVMKNQYI